MLGETLFFETIPDRQPDVDVIVKVSLSDVSDGMSTATIMQVLKTSDARIYRGTKISLKYGNSSCGPEPANGAEGIIIAKAGKDSKGRLVLYPYVHNHYGRISLPFVSD